MLYSYVVEHDYGLSPNPTGGFCTLTFCKFSREGITPNIVELAQVGDWVGGDGREERHERRPRPARLRDASDGEDDTAGLLPRADWSKPTTR
jgi:hypothetical protein